MPPHHQKFSKLSYELKNSSIAHQINCHGFNWNGTEEKGNNCVVCTNVVNGFGEEKYDNYSAGLCVRPVRDIPNLNSLQENKTVKCCVDDGVKCSFPKTSRDNSDQNRATSFETYCASSNNTDLLPCYPCAGNGVMYFYKFNF